MTTQVNTRKAHQANKTYGCDDCKMLRRYGKGARCIMWDKKITDAHNSYCEAHEVKQKTIKGYWRL